MRYKDIPQFTRAGGWECDFDFPFRFVREIDRMIKEDGLQLNPDFQRGHVWTDDQQIAYIEFLLRGGKTARVIYLNNPNWQIHKSDSYTDFVCVDGLQRITAIKRFVNDEIPVFGAYQSEYEDVPSISTSMKINVNDLKTRREVLQWYIDFNAGGTIHTDVEIQKVRMLLAQEQ